MIYLQLLMDGVQSGCIFALTAAGFSFIFGSTRVFHVAHGALFMISAYLFVYMVTIIEWPIYLATIFTALISIAIGVLLYYYIYRFIQRSKHSFYTVFIASFGVLLITQSVVALIFGGGVWSVDTRLGIGQEIASGLFISPLAIITISVTFILFSCMAIFLKITRTGKAIRALSYDAKLLRVYGYSPVYINLSIFAIGTLLVVPAAILFSLESGISPIAGDSILMICIAATIVGGVGSIIGSAIAALAIGLIYSVSLMWIGGEWVVGLTFAIMVIFMLFRPKGFLGVAK